MEHLLATRPDGSATSSLSIEGEDESLLAHLFAEWLRDHGWEVEEVAEEDENV